MVFKFDKKIKDFVSGGYHNLILTDEGDVYGFGSNIYGQLGLGDRSSRFTPTLIDYFQQERIIADKISVGKNFSFVISSKIFIN